MNQRQREILERELRVEVPAGHLLKSRKWEIIARRMDKDDLVLRLATGQVAVVHLTWSSKVEKDNYPRTILFQDEIEFRNKEMWPVIQDYRE